MCGTLHSSWLAKLQRLGQHLRFFKAFWQLHFFKDVFAMLVIRGIEDAEKQHWNGYALGPGCWLICCRHNRSFQSVGEVFAFWSFVFLGGFCDSVNSHPVGLVHFTRWFSCLVGYGFGSCPLWTECSVFPERSQMGFFGSNWKNPRLSQQIVKKLKGLLKNWSLEVIDPQILSGFTSPRKCEAAKAEIRRNVSSSVQDSTEFSIQSPVVWRFPRKRWPSIRKSDKVERQNLELLSLGP